ncbi:hypothetical protein CVT25_001286 [Psilocybe cyanescens]|uniref:Uncharacterized protein n=1 Tax=Psilocybe cyanescens TaxID=93625 RepID=A0A409XM87_PSICY|nr:hypothetical protein CVT25_001286 [Psilocybe cyanescens]
MVEAYSLFAALRQMLENTRITYTNVGITLLLLFVGSKVVQYRRGLQVRIKRKEGGKLLARIPHPIPPAITACDDPAKSFMESQLLFSLELALYM